MPTSNPGGCDANCASDITAYIRSWVPQQEVACELNTGFSYGRRQLRLLTRSEYVNSINDLIGFEVDASTFGVPSNTVIESFANQVFTPVTQAYMDAYVSIAEAAANYAESQNFAGIADCTNDSTAQCANKFINEFAYKAYRRPLTPDEAALYRALFVSSLSEGNNSEGLKLAIRSALSSPHFLYRSEMGRRVSDIIDEIDNGDPVFTPGENSVTFSGTEIGANAGEDHNSINLYQNYGATQSQYTFTGNDIITIVARGNFANEAWPSLQLRVDNSDVDTISVNSDSDTEYSFLINGVTGSNKYIQVTNVINSAQHSEGRALELRSITYGNAVQVEIPRPDANLDQDAYVLSQYELASFLAYTYTGSTPDDSLYNAAVNNELRTDTQIQTQITRLLATDKARNHFGEFAAQWLHADKVLSATKSTEVFPEFTPDIRHAMATEVREIVKHVIFDNNQPITNIFDDFSFVNAPLANFYGIPGVQGNDFTKVSNLAERGGVLTSGAFMAGFAHEKETSPIKRAVAVREDLLCQKVPPMPTNIELARELADGALEEYIQGKGGVITNRDRYGFQTQGAPCSDCHQEIINPHGFGMEDFDAVGLVRAMDANNLNIDASGELIGTYTLADGERSDFHGAKQLSETLAALPATRECFSKKSFRFAMGVGHDVFDHIAENAPVLSGEEKSGYACALDSMNASMNQSNNNARAGLITLGLRDIVRYRKQR